MPDMSRAFARVIYEFLEGGKELSEVRGLARTSIGLTRFLPTIVSMVEEMNPEEAKNLDVEKIEWTLAMAKQEVESGFPHLFRQAAISLWSLYEVAITRFAVAWVEEAGTAGFSDDNRIRKWSISIPITEAMDWWAEKERSDFAEEVVGEIRRNVGFGSGGNPQGFEQLLEVLGLSPPRDSDRRRAIREAWSIRNLFVHRGHRADQRFLDQYPGDEYGLGDEVSVDNRRFIRFHNALIDEVAVLGDEADRAFKEILDDETRRPSWRSSK